jgi:hypothetical protein
VRRRALALVLVLAGLWCLWTATRRPLAVEGTAAPDRYTRVAGVVHVHTTLSDGGGSVDDVVRAAKAAGLAFVAITEHNNVDVKPFEGYRDGVLVIAGTELSTTEGHVLGLGTSDPPFRFSGDAADGLADLRDLGGAAFAAHPTSARADFRWTGWDLAGPWGIEVLNADSQWRAAGPARLALAAIRYPLNPPYALARSWTADAEALERWDRMLATRDVPAIVGADAHQRAALGRRLTLPVPSYESLFRVARNHVLLDAPLTGESAADARAIVGALARGRSYAAVDAIAPAGLVSFGAEGGGARATMGETIAPRPGLRVALGGMVPRGARLVIVRNGQVHAEATTAPLTAAADAPGVYRGEIHVAGWGVPWVLTNAIVVADEPAAARRRASATWPAEPPAPAAAEVLDAFDAGTGFAVNCDTASPLKSPSIDPTGGVGGSPAALLHFRLAEPTKDHPDVFCALVNARERDLSGRSGLAFSIRGDGAYRVWVQVRDANPASAEEGIEWWFGSVRTAPEWRRVAIPFARLRSVDPKTDGRLDLDKVRALVFVVDKGSLKPGAEARIWIDDVGAY